MPVIRKKKTPPKKPLVVREIAYHRNGVAGTPFHVILYTEGLHNQCMTFVATVFPDPGHVAVLRLDLLSEKEIRFGENSWRGDEVEMELRAAIQKWTEKQKSEFEKSLGKKISGNFGRTQ